MTFSASRDVAAPPSEVFAAFTDVARVTRWWGADGINASFTEFAFATGARWLLSLHSRDGRAWANEIHLVSVEPHRIELENITAPRYRLILTLDALGEGTRVTLLQRFENEAVGESMSYLVEPANEQLLRRLEAEVTARPV